MEDINKIQSKIIKLMAVAERSANHFEAANALGKARALIEKYQIENLSFLDTEQKANFLKVVSKEIPTTYEKIPLWLQTLAVRVAKFNDCEAGITSRIEPNFGIRKNIKIMGIESDVDLAVKMFLSISNQIDLLSEKQKGKKLSYRMGLVAGLSWEFDKIKENLRRESDCTSLVLCKSEAIKEEFGERKYKTSNRKHVTKEFITGLSDSKKISINDKVK